MIGRPETHPVKKVIGFTEDMISAVEAWRSKQTPVPNLSEAIRRLVERALTAAASQPAVPSIAKETAARAADLAAKTIYKQIDSKAPAEERAVRKRTLLHGPSDFREGRKDRTE